MAVNYGLVDISNISFGLFTWASGDSTRDDYSIADVSNALSTFPTVLNSSVFLKMLSLGLNHLDLHDDQSNVIGSLDISNYNVYYSTREFDANDNFVAGGDRTYGYVPYVGTYASGYRCKFAKAPDSGSIVYSITLNGQTITWYGGTQTAPFSLTDGYGTYLRRCGGAVFYGNSTESAITVSIFDAFDPGTGLPHKYMNFTRLNGYPISTQDHWVNYRFMTSPTIMCDNLDVDDHTTQEDGYVNDLQERFCPRVNAGSVGIYAASYDTIQLLMQGLMECDAGDVLKNVFLGGDGKEYVIGLRWYYGLYDNSNVWLNLNENDNYKVQVGGVFLDVGGTVLLGKKFIGEYATWTSSEMDVPRTLDNYLDYFSDYQLYLPYYGFLKLHPNDVVGGKIRVIYNINIVTGMADIIVECKNSRSRQQAYKAYTVNAQIGVDIPYASDIMKTAVASWMQTCGKAFMTGASMGAYGATQEYANAIQKSPRADIHQNALDLISAGESHNQASAERIAMKEAAISKIKTGLHNAGATAKYTGAQMSTAMSQFMTEPSPSVSRTGGSNTENGTLDELFPYLVITHPIDNSPADYEDYVGLPACTSVQLNQCTGFTQVAAVKPESMTDAPKYADEILSLLQAGVYL